MAIGDLDFGAFSQLSPYGTGEDTGHYHVVPLLHPDGWIIGTFSITTGTARGLYADCRAINSDGTFQSPTAGVRLLAFGGSSDRIFGALTALNNIIIVSGSDAGTNLEFASAIVDGLGNITAVATLDTTLDHDVMDMIPIPGTNIILVAYQHPATGDLNLCTIGCDADGTNLAVIDTWETTYGASYESVKLAPTSASDIFAVCFRNTSDGYVSVFTTTVNSDGTFDEDEIDIEALYSNTGVWTAIQKISDTLFCIASLVSGSGNKTITSFTISGAGAISAAIASAAMGSTHIADREMWLGNLFYDSGTDRYFLVFTYTDDTNDRSYCYDFRVDSDGNNITSHDYLNLSLGYWFSVAEVAGPHCQTPHNGVFVCGARFQNDVGQIRSFLAEAPVIPASSFPFVWD